MPQAIVDIDVLQVYVRGVLSRAEHHANNVDEICLAIAGAIVWRKDGDVEVMTREGEMKNVLWLRANGQRYAISYNHDQGQIEVRGRNTQGPVLASFTNATPISDVKAFFGSL